MPTRELVERRTTDQYFPILIKWEQEYEGLFDFGSPSYYLISKAEDLPVNQAFKIIATQVHVVGG